MEVLWLRIIMAWQLVSLNLTVLLPALEAANVKIQNVERNRLGAGACVKMRGSVSDVTAAMDAALKVAEPLTKIFSHTIIASPAHDTEPAMYMTAGK